MLLKETRILKMEQKEKVKEEVVEVLTEKEIEEVNSAY